MIRFLTSAALMALSLATMSEAHSGRNVPTYPLSSVQHATKAPARLLYMYQGRLNEHGYATRRQVREACAYLGRASGFGPVLSDFGCSVWNGDHSECTIVYLIGKPHVYWHEIAHCNGGNFHG